MIAAIDYRTILTLTHRAGMVRSESMICTKENGELINIELDAVDCIRGNTLRDGSEGATVYMLDGRYYILRNRFAELLTASGQK